MSNFGEKINRGLYEGRLPSESLSAAKIIKPKKVDIAHEAEAGLSILRENPELFYLLFVSSRDRIHEIESSNFPHAYEQEINILINTGYLPSSVNIISDVYQSALKTIPVVTNLDKYIWQVAFVDYFSLKNGMVDHPDEITEMIYAWVYLLLYVQDKEVSSGTTINTNKCDLSSNFLEFVFSPWINDGDLYLPLSPNDMKRLELLKDQRKSLSAMFQAEIDTSFKVAEETNDQWTMFLSLMNDIQHRESIAIQRICENGTKRDKLSAISDYNYVLLGIEKGRYTLNGNEIQLLPLFDAINERFIKAFVHCTVQVDDQPFIVFPVIFMLAMNPRQTFNYLLLSFHQFRMQPNRENTNRFIDLALASLKKNLNSRNIDMSFVNQSVDQWFAIEQSIANMTFDEKVYDFLSAVDTFYKENHETIDSLSFDTIQSDSSSVLFTNDSYDSDLGHEWKDYIVETSNAQFDKAIDDIFEGKNKPQSPEEVSRVIRFLNEMSNTAEKIALAQQLISSLNIIYLFCEALRIVLTDSHVNIKIKNPETISQCRYKLLKYDSQLVQKVYSHLSEQEIVMLKYRERKGIDSRILSDQEVYAEQYRNVLFSEVLKDAINRIASHIEDDTNDQLLVAKAKIKEEILRFPDCDEKDQYADWLDTISERINQSLIKNCKREADKYSRHKATIVSGLGNKCNHLPDSTIDSLTTAEMLYEEYASDEYAQKGFDFSCISALYYQAFENAYNALFWNGYASKLNSLKVHGKFFSFVLDLRRNHNGMGAYTDADGYLPSDSRDRDYYVSYRNKQNPRTKVSERCMYKSFGIIMGNITSNSSLPKFMDYFADIAGFASSTEMINDSDYLQACSTFATIITSSADNRNNASHGGTMINLVQCAADKKTIISNLEEVRRTSIGLIQQLLYLLYIHES